MLSVTKPKRSDSRVRKNTNELCVIALSCVRLGFVKRFCMQIIEAENFVFVCGSYNESERINTVQVKLMIS